MSVEPLETHHIVWGYDCGYGGPFKPIALANYFQEAAGDHAAALGIGMEDMFAEGRTWMLSRLDIRAERLPETGEEVLVRTWPAGTERIFALRCIELLAKNGERLAGALYEYLIVDIEKRKPLRPERILNPGLKTELARPYPDLKPGLQEIPEFALADKNSEVDKDTEGAFAESFRLTAGPRHIDSNGHVNNAHIIDWLCDAVPKERRGAGQIRRIKVDFVAEVKLGDQIVALWMEKRGVHYDGCEYLSAIVRNGEIVGRSLTRWE